MTDHCAVQTFCLGLNEAFAVAWLWYHDLLSSDVASCEMICGTTPVLICTTKTYNVLLPVYSVLQSTAPVLQSTMPVLQNTTLVLLCTTKYYASTTISYAKTTLYYKVLLQYYKVLRQYYFVLQSTALVLLCTTNYYASTTKYYASTTKNYDRTALCNKVLRQYYSVLQSTTPVLQSITLYYKVLRQYYKVLFQYYYVLLCTTQYYGSVVRVASCHAMWCLGMSATAASAHSVLESTTTYYSSTTLSYKVLLQYHTVLQSTTPVLFCTTPVLQLMTPVLLWNVMYNARCNKSQRPTSPNTAPATQNECHQWSASHMKRYFQCVDQVKSPSNLTKYCACHAKWMSSMICVTYEAAFPMRGPSEVTLQPHQILRLPRKMNVINDLRHKWNLISNARTK